MKKPKKQKKQKNKRVASPKKLDKHLTAFATEIEEQIGMKGVSSKALGFKTKLSDSLLKYAKPLIDTVYMMELSEIEEGIMIEEVIDQATFFWNISFFSHDEAASKLFNTPRSLFSTRGMSMEKVIEYQRYIKPIFEIMYERKYDLFAKETRFIVQIEKSCQNRNIRVNIAALDLKDHPHLLELFSKQLNQQ
jgi:hypothetical protein